MDAFAKSEVWGSADLVGYLAARIERREGYGRFLIG
jgi:hypothetical protein